jgi:serine protease Do
MTMTSLEPTPDEPQDTVPYGLVKKLALISAAFGVIGGLVGGYVLIRYLPTVIPIDRQRVTLQENSAITEVVKQVGPSVVSISTQSSSIGFFGRQQQSSAGTGIVLTEDGLILTNKHVIENTDEVTVVTSDGKEYQGAKVVARDPLNDIAFIRINAKGLKPAELGDSSALVVGQRVLALGNALGRFQNTATEGIVSGLGRPLADVEGFGGLDNLIQTDAAINPGNSGGPLVNLAGQVVGINTAVAGGAQNIGFAIPVNEVQAAIESVKSQGRVVRPYLGVRYVMITPELAQRNNLKTNEGAYIAGDANQPGVLPDSPAAKAGLQNGDIITEINGTKLSEKNTLTSLIGRHKVGDKVGLTVRRGDQTLALEATLEEAR